MDLFQVRSDLGNRSVGRGTIDGWMDGWMVVMDDTDGELLLKEGRSKDILPSWLFPMNCVPVKSLRTYRSIETNIVSLSSFLILIIV